MEDISLKQNQQLLIPLLWIGDKEEISINVKLIGNNSKLTILGLLVGKNDDTLQLRINVTHKGKDTKSEVILKGVLKDRTKVNFEGLVKIENGAKQTNAWLGSNFLLLSDQAKGRAVPSLEILENDIKAGHAATVGKVNEIEMFYLMSRGLSETQSKELIVEGFLQSLMNRFPDKEKMAALRLLGNASTRYTRSANIS